MTKRDCFKQISQTPIAYLVFHKTQYDIFENLEISREDIIIKTRNYNVILIQGEKINSIYLGWFIDYLEKYQHLTPNELLSKMMWDLCVEFIPDYEFVDCSKGFVLEGRGRKASFERTKEYNKIHIVKTRVRKSRCIGNINQKGKSIYIGSD